MATGPPLRDHALEEIRHTLAHVSDRPEGVGVRILPALAAHLDSDHAAAYSLRPGDGTIDVEYYHTHGGAFSGWPAVFAEILRRHPTSLLQYDAIRPPPAQRNRAILIDASRLAAVVEANQGPFELLGRHPTLLRNFVSFDELRALVCDGPVLLAWIGAVRDTPFEPSEVRRLQRLVPLLRERLVLDARLGVDGAAGVALDVAMERIGSAAFIVSPRASVVHANATGRALRDRSPEHVSAALARCARGGSDGLWSVTRVVAPGLPPHALVLRRSPVADPASRAAALSTRWRLTRRQAEVLLGVARGDTNKGIAARLACAESTVEAHVTALFARAGCSGRSALAARVWAAS